MGIIRWWTGRRTEGLAWPKRGRGCCTSSRRAQGALSTSGWFSLAFRLTFERVALLGSSSLLEFEEVTRLDNEGEAGSNSTEKGDAAKVRPRLGGRVDVQDLSTSSQLGSQGGGGGGGKRGGRGSDQRETHRVQGARDEVRARVEVERVGGKAGKVSCEHGDAEES